MTQALAERLAAEGVRDERVLAAVAAVPRARFVPAALEGEADADRPLPIGQGQTISQPFVVGFMSEALRLTGEERVLEVGTGSGYQTAILARLAREVWSVEVRPELAARAAEALRELGVANVHLRVGDGRLGWPEAAPFEAILVAAAPSEVPPALVEQLAPGGRLVLPVGADPERQVLRRIERDAAGALREVDLLAVRFVPLTGAPRGG